MKIEEEKELQAACSGLENELQKRASQSLMVAAQGRLSLHRSEQAASWKRWLKVPVLGQPLEKEMQFSAMEQDKAERETADEAKLRAAAQGFCLIESQKSPLRAAASAVAEPPAAKAPPSEATFAGALPTTSANPQIPGLSQVH